MQHVESQELDEFIFELLKKPQERIFLLKLENDLEAFINNYQMYRLDLPQMNSYQRRMVHKVAPYFKLSHFHDPNRKSVYLCKNQYTEL
ncbi:single-stranded nucleic acid binding R3H [Phycomyces nitens]|nr:single-stranded nucleic acid binding R3H [Phycomyces nitens]